MNSSWFRCLPTTALTTGRQYTKEYLLLLLLLEIIEFRVRFFDTLPKDVRGIGREVADLYGRYNPDKFREVWEKLAG
jgi:hypothetical protein